jgi:ankyrin repeat protein
MESVVSMSSSSADLIYEAIAAGSLPQLLNSNRFTQGDLDEALVSLASNGGVGWASQLVLQGGDPNAKDDEGNTPLSGCIHGAFEARTTGATFVTATELLSLGANPNGRYQQMSLTALALHFSMPEFVALFLFAGAELGKPEPDPYSPLTLKELLERSEHDWARQLALMAKRSETSTGS